MLSGSKASVRPGSSPRCSVKRVQLRTQAAGGGGGNGSGFRRGYGGDGNGHDGQQPRLPSWLAMASLLSAGQLLMSGSAEAKKKEEPPPPPPPEPIESMADQLWTLCGPILTNLGFSGVLGLVSAAAFKMVGKVLAVLVGLAFAGMQLLSYYGYINVNWSKVHTDVVNIVDQNNDGKLDADDFKLVVKNFAGVLSQGVPSVGGFCAGFMLGLRMF